MRVGLVVEGAALHRLLAALKSWHGVGPRVCGWRVSAPGEQLLGSGKRRVLVIDDHPIVRQGLANLIDQEDDLCVSDQASDAQQAMESIAKQRPDVAIVDISLGDRSGLELIKEVRARFSEVRRASPEQLALNRMTFQAPRFDELLFRYRARNWPQTLDAADAARWREYRMRRLETDCGLSDYTFDSYFAEIDQLRIERGGEAGVPAMLDALQAWGLRLREEL